MVTFLFPSFFLHLLFGILPKGGAIFSFPFIYIWLFISIRANSCLVCGDNLALFIYLFNFPNCSALAPGSFFRCYLKFLCAPPLKAKPKTDVLPTFGKHFLALWLHKMLQAHLAFSLPQAWSQQFLQRGLTPLTGEWASGMFPAARASSLRGPLSWETGNKCIYTNIGIHIVLCFFLYLFVNTVLSVIDRRSRFKISMDIEVLNNFDLTDVYRTLPSTKAEYIFSQMHIIWPLRYTMCLANCSVHFKNLKYGLPWWYSG